jgi:hypothetical protein
MMARKLKDIFEDISTGITANSELSGLAPSNASFDDLLQEFNTNSKVSAWRIMAYVFAVGVWTVELLFDQYLYQLGVNAESYIVGTKPWYVKLVKNYNTISIPYVAVRELPNGTLKVKVLNFEQKPLSLSELQELAGYLNARKFVGTRLLLSSVNPDLVRVDIDVTCTNRSLSDVSTEVAVVIVNYLSSTFDGDLYSIRLIDEVQKVRGVVDVTLNMLKFSSDGGINFSDAQSIQELPSGLATIVGDITTMIHVNTI